MKQNLIAEGAASQPQFRSVLRLPFLVPDTPILSFRFPLTKRLIALLLSILPLPCGVSLQARTRWQPIACNLYLPAGKCLEQHNGIIVTISTPTDTEKLIRIKQA